MIDSVKEILETNDTARPSHLSDSVSLIDSTAQQNNIEDQVELNEISPRTIRN